MCRRDMDDTWEQQLVCYSLLKDNGTVNGIVIVMGRRKKKTTFYYCLFNSIQISLSGLRVEFSRQTEFKIKMHHLVLNRAVKHHLITPDMKSTAQNNSNNPVKNIRFSHSQEAASERVTVSVFKAQCVCKDKRPCSFNPAI